MVRNIMIWKFKTIDNFPIRQTCVIMLWMCREMYVTKCNYEKNVCGVHDESSVNDNKSFWMYNKILCNANLRIQNRVNSFLFTIYNLTKRVLAKKKWSKVFFQ